MAFREYQARCATVADEFAAAYPEYVREHMAALVPEPDALAATIADAQSDLSAVLEEWAQTAPNRQTASPLELFREALAPPTALALELGAQPVVRSGPDAAAMPGDLLGIAPATSRDIGEAAWHAHVAWGLARAEAIAGMVPRPVPAPAGARVAVVGSNLMDRTQIESAAGNAGYEVLLWRNPGAIADGMAAGVPSVAFIDLTHPVAIDAIRTLAAAGVRTVAFGPHVDDHALAAAASVGADEVLPRSQFFRRLPHLFPQGI